MKVKVEIITGTFIDTEVSENATVKELKEKIATDLKMSVNRLILVVGDEEIKRRIVKENEDELMLRGLGVREDSHMYLFFKHPDLVSQEERSRGGGDDVSMEESSSEAESKRGNEEEEDKQMKNEEEDRDEQEKVEDEEEKEMNGEGEKNGKEIQEDDRKEET